MAVPKRRKTRSRRDMRRGHDVCVGLTISEDPVTGEKHQRHCVTATGFYRGKLVVPKLAKAYEDEDN